MADENEEVTVGEILDTSINMHDGFLILWLRAEVLTVDPVSGNYTSTFTDWAIHDNRRTEAKDARPVIAGFTPRANQMTLDPGSIVWNKLNNPQATALDAEAATNGISVSIVPDDLVP